MKHRVRSVPLLGCTLLSGTGFAAQDTPGNAELWKIIQQQQEMEALKHQLKSTTAQASRANEKAESAASALEPTVPSAGISRDLDIQEGLAMATTGADAFVIRDGRKETSKAPSFSATPLNCSANCFSSSPSP